MAGNGAAAGSKPVVWVTRWSSKIGAPISGAADSRKTRAYRSWPSRKRGTSPRRRKNLRPTVRFAGALESLPLLALEYRRGIALKFAWQRAPINWQQCKADAGKTKRRSRYAGAGGDAQRVTPKIDGEEVVLYRDGGRRDKGRYHQPPKRVGNKDTARRVLASSDR